MFKGILSAFAVAAALPGCIGIDPEGDLVITPPYEIKCELIDMKGKPYTQSNTVYAYDCGLETGGPLGPEITCTDSNGIRVTEIGDFPSNGKGTYPCRIAF